MSRLHLISDHVYDWSDRPIRQAFLGVAPAPPDAAAATATVGCDSARLAHRALQALRQAGVQVCRWAWSRPEVLPVGEFPGRASPDGLRAAGGTRRDPYAHRQLPPSTQRSGGD